MNDSASGKCARMPCRRTAVCRYLEVLWNARDCPACVTKAQTRSGSISFALVALQMLIVLQGKAGTRLAHMNRAHRFR